MHAQDEFRRGNPGDGHEKPKFKVQGSRLMKA
jgi:hypothetical protein